MPTARSCHGALRRILVSAAVASTAAAVVQPATAWAMGRQSVRRTAVPGLSVAVLGDATASLAGAKNETAVAVDPQDPQRMAVGFNWGSAGADDYGYTMGIATSDDGGLHWRARALKTGDRSRYTPIGDPQLAWTANGLYAAYVALPRGSSNAGRLSCEAALSRDGGEHFRVLGHIGGCDYPKLAVADNSDGSDSVWVTWHQVVSSDWVNGVFLDHVNVGGDGNLASPWQGNLLSRSHGMSADMPADDWCPSMTADQQGLPVVAWEEASPTALGRDPFTQGLYAYDGAVNQPGTYSFAAATDVFNSGGFAYPADPRGAYPPAIAVDRSQGAHRGRIYLAYTAAVPPQPGISTTKLGTEIMLTSSDDGGHSWSAPQRADGGLDEQDRFMPMVQVGTDGNVLVAWRRAPRDSVVSQVYAVVSNDGGATFSPVTKVGPPSGASDGMGAGDYSQITAAPDGSWLLAIPGNARHLRGENDIFVARVTATNEGLG